MSASLVGSEMCIRDRRIRASRSQPDSQGSVCPHRFARAASIAPGALALCLLYTSDAADDM
eukprot:7385566-Alexandrium_andersonii.AAC.1